jgi:acyl-homoserine-lactone acylase
MTMVMADNQDIFLEKIRQEGGRYFYEYKGQWVPVSERTETFAVRGRDPVKATIRETVHGPLLNDTTRKPPMNLFMADQAELPLGMALSWAAFEPGDRSLDAFFSLAGAKTVQEAIPLLREFRVMALNMAVADRDSIAWQVTGRYPLRKNGRGLFPSPGWPGDYDWTGFLDVKDFPSAMNPAEGFMGTANNKTVSRDYPHVLSSSWYWPDRADRIREMITSTESHSQASCMAMHLDTRSISCLRMKKLLTEGDLARDLSREIEAWTDAATRDRAREALSLIRAFDGDMKAGSRGALVLSALTHALTLDIFLDEMGPRNRPCGRLHHVQFHELQRHHGPHLPAGGREPLLG